MQSKREIEKDIRHVFGGNIGLLSESQIKEYTGFGKEDPGLPASIVGWYAAACHGCNGHVV